MAEAFERTERLTGKEVLERFRRATVLVFGIGGVGSHCIEALARGGVGRLILVDHDTISVSNINRQSIAYHSTTGRYKTEIMKGRIADIHPEAEVITYEMFVLPENIEGIFEIRPDYIVDAVDTVAAKLAIAEKAQKYGIPLISSMGTGNKLHGELFEIADIYETSVCPLCKVMRKELKARNIRRLKVLYSKEKPVAVPADGKKEKPEKETGGGKRQKAAPGSISFVPPVAGLLIAGEVMRELGGL